MKKLTLALITSLFFVSSYVVAGLRDEVVGDKKNISTQIDVGNHIYGYPFGISKDNFIKQEGLPTGYIKLTATRTAVIYGSSHAYIFTNNKLSGLRIDTSILDWKLANQIENLEKHTSENWILSNGIHYNMTEKALKDLLGAKLNNHAFNPHIEINGYRVDLHLATYPAEDNKEPVKKICGIFISKINKPEKAKERIDQP